MHVCNPQSIRLMETGLEIAYSEDVPVAAAYKLHSHGMGVEVGDTVAVAEFVAVAEAEAVAEAVGAIVVVEAVVVAVVVIVADTEDKSIAGRSGRTVDVGADVSELQSETELGLELEIEFVWVAEIVGTVDVGVVSVAGVFEM